MIYEKITKTQARKMHAEGKTVYATASKVSPYSIWMPPHEIPKDVDFDKFCGEYYFYNCTTITGLVVTFYKQEFSSLTCFGKYKTKKDCQSAIDSYKEV